MDISNINSIINPNSEIAGVGDNINPYTFIEFITKTSNINSEEIFLTEYQEYLALWSELKKNNGANISTKELIFQQIIDLLKIITVSYTSLEEQLFLSNLNWDFKNITDPTEQYKAKQSINSALPIFITRIKEICNFYKDKRDSTSFSIERNKIKGTKKSIEKIIFDRIINFAFNDSIKDVSYIQNYLNISIDNFVDVYTNYFDLDQSNANTVDYNNINTSLYFELESILQDMLYDGNVYLYEIPLIAQLSLDLSQECVGDKLVLKNELIEKNYISLISDEEKLNLKKKLYAKYLGVDFYYLFKNDDNEIISDIFIKAENPTNNLLNQQTIDTPYTESKQLVLLKDIGLFFKPSKTSILRVETKDFTYRIDTENIEANKIYIFPDPTLYGNVSFNKQKEYPLIMEYSLINNSKSDIFGWAEGDVLAKNGDQCIFPYYSREQDINTINENDNINLGFNELYNKGFISTIKTDIYGNKFVLFKEQMGKYTRDWDITPFKPTIEENTDPMYIPMDGGILGVDDIGADTQVSADKIEWTPTNHWYDYFFEAGISRLIPDYFRAYIPAGGTIGNGNLKLNISFVKDYYDVDGGTFDIDYNEYPEYGFTGNQELPVLEEGYESILHEPNTPSYEENSKKTLFDIENNIGEIRIKTFNSDNSIGLNEAFPWLFSGQHKELYENFISNTYDLEIFKNILTLKAYGKNDSINIVFIPFDIDAQTFKFKEIFSSNKIIAFYDDILKLYYDGFETKTFESFDPVMFKDNTNKYDKCSNLFYSEIQNKVYFVSMNLITQQTVPILYPTIHEISLDNYEYKKYIIDDSNEMLIDLFSIPNNLGYDIFSKIGTLNLTYNYDYNIFMLVYSVKDTDNNCHIFKHLFKLNISNKNNIGKIDIDSIDSTIYKSTQNNTPAITIP